MTTDQTKTLLRNALISLEGLSVGDAFGEQFFEADQAALTALQTRTAPVPPAGYSWSYTDDTEMALSLVASLDQFGKINQNWVAKSFAEHYDHSRGYGMGMYQLLEQIKQGKSWSREAKRLFHNEGSFGNGAAMRVAPVGAYFADDTLLVIKQAQRSAEITHAHYEGITGAIAVAFAAALASRWRQSRQPLDPKLFLLTVMGHSPINEVRVGIERAANLPPDTSVAQAVEQLGNGSEITVRDTVPFALWCAAHYLNDYETALWQTASGLGDCDTTCAMVGGIVACYTGLAGIPAKWREYREPLDDWFLAE